MPFYHPILVCETFFIINCVLLTQMGHRIHWSPDLKPNPKNPLWLNPPLTTNKTTNPKPFLLQKMSRAQGWQTDDNVWKCVIKEEEIVQHHIKVRFFFLCLFLVKFLFAENM